MMAINLKRFQHDILIVILTSGAFLCLINYNLLKSELSTLPVNILGNVRAKRNSYIWNIYQQIRERNQSSNLTLTPGNDTTKETLKTHNGEQGHVDNTAMCSNQSLVGRLEISASVTADMLKNDSVLQNVKYGGHYRPHDCTPRQRVAIIVPYRDRLEHLTIFLYYMHAFLQRQQLEYCIYVVEMALPTQFNRGLLANVGFRTAASSKHYDCFVIHDVDLLPLDDRHSYTCATNPRHLSVNNRKFQRRIHKGLPYKTFTGGVLALSTSMYWKINGYSNLYFGWGGEDDDMSRRLAHMRYRLERDDPTIGVYEALYHARDTSNPSNPARFNLVRKAKQRMRKDGLRNVQYRRLALEFRDLYTWIYVAVDEAKIMQTAINASMI